ncbi:hypothetical protein NQZ68_007130 [Dissostichus eleginoides]|nr:hypothetical protein NQZ68_007130 [Dissostichus eleginoides]
MLALLPRVLLSHVLPAMIKLPSPVNINLTSSHFKHELRWEPGPGTPTGVYYHVAVMTDRATLWVPVAGCQHVQSPLVCNLTEAFPVRNQRYLTKISALLDSQPGEVTFVIHPGFEPNKDTALDLPLLTVTPCGHDLCVDPRPPVEHLRAFYDNRHYKLRIQSNNANNAQSFMDTQSMERVILKNLASGRQYCVSVRISDVWERRKSNYSQPVCAFTLDHYTADPWISASLILLVICALVVLALMLYTGSICMTQRPLPSVLRSIHHIEERTVVPSCNSSLSSLLNLEPAAPPSGEKSSSHSSDESDEEEESVTERPRGGRGGEYQVRGGPNPLSSSSSSSGSAPLSPQPLPGQTVCYNPSPPAETCTSAGLQPASPSPTDTHCSTIGTKVEGGGGSREVNLLTLTFGSHGEGEEGKSHFDTVEVEPEVEAQAADKREVAIETVSCPGDEDEEEEEEEEDEDEQFGYKRR